MRIAEYISIEIYSIYTAAQKFGISKIFNVFFKEVSSAHQGCNYSIKKKKKKKKKKTVNVKYYCN